MYGMVAILLPASMIACTCGGASVGAIAWPFGRRIALPCAWNSGSVGPAPPVLESAVATAGSAHAITHANAAKQQRMYAGSPDILFRTPAGLADGLALKELARFLERKFAPTTWFPRSGQARIRRGGYGSKRPGRSFAPLLLSYAHLELQVKRACSACGGQPGARGAEPRRFSQ